MKTVIIGSVDQMSADDIWLWAKSIRSTGYTDDIVLLSYRIPSEQLTKYKILIDTFGIELLSSDYDENAQPLNLVGPISNQTQNHIWRMRFFHIWQFLTDRTEYTHVINSDVRDIVFQRNPNEVLHTITNGVIGPAEGVKMMREDWNAKSVQECFGPYVWECAAKDFMIYNCGSWGGSANIVKWLALTIFMMSHRRANPGDQPAFNVLMNGLLKECGVAKHMGMNDEWACQCALTFEPSRKHLRGVLEHDIPVMGSDGIVRTASGLPYVIVHQYDRVPGWKDAIQHRLNS
jgi:hypothetical protein